MDSKTKAGIAGAALATILVGPRGILLGKTIAEGVHDFFAKPANDNRKKPGNEESAAS